MLPPDQATPRNMHRRRPLMTVAKAREGEDRKCDALSICVPCEKVTLYATVIASDTRASMSITAAVSASSLSAWGTSASCLADRHHDKHVGGYIGFALMHWRCGCSRRFSGGHFELEADPCRRQSSKMPSRSMAATRTC